LSARKLPIGTPAIIQHVIRDDGASLQYVPGARRRVHGHPWLLTRLRLAARKLNVHIEEAIGLSTDAFYAGSALQYDGRLQPATLLPLKDDIVPVAFQDWVVPLLAQDQPCCVDMEVATFYTLADLVHRSANMRWASVKGISNE